VARHYGGLLRDHDLQPSRFELIPLELAVVEFIAVGLHHPAMAERIASSGIESEPWFGLSLEGLCQVRQATVMVLVPVADDQGVGRGGIDFQAFEIVCERAGRESEVHQDLFFLCASEGLHVKGQPMFRQQRDL
jgi:hypothetical protein